MKKLLVITLGTILILSSLVFAQETTIEDTSGFNFINYLQNTFSFQSFSIVGVNRQCSSSADVTSPLFPRFDSMTAWIASNECSSGNQLINVFDGNWNAIGEWKDTPGLICGDSDGCLVEVYCCPYPECTSDTQCVSQIGAGSQCQTRTANDPNINYQDGNTFNYCTDAGVLINCWYQSGSSCTSVEQLDSCPSTFMSETLYTSQSICESNIITQECDLNQFRCRSDGISLDVCNSDLQWNLNSASCGASSAMECVSGAVGLNVCFESAVCNSDGVCDSGENPTNCASDCCVNGNEICGGNAPIGIGQNNFLCVNNQWSSQGQVIGKCGVTEGNEVGDTCDSNSDCNSQFCDKSAWYSLGTTCQPTPWSLIKKVGLTREQIGDSTLNDLLSIACLENSECIPIEENQTAKCIPISVLKDDGVLIVGVDSFFDNAKDAINAGVTGGAVGGVIGAVTCAGAIGATVVLVPTVAGSVVFGAAAATACTTFIGAGAILGAQVGLNYNDKDLIVEKLEAENADEVGLCVSDSGGGFGLCSLALIDITGDCETDGIIIAIILLFVLVVIIR